MLHWLIIGIYIIVLFLWIHLWNKKHSNGYSTNWIENFEAQQRAQLEREAREAANRLPVYKQTRYLGK